MTLILNASERKSEVLHREYSNKELVNKLISKGFNLKELDDLFEGAVKSYPLDSLEEYSGLHPVEEYDDNGNQVEVYLLSDYFKKESEVFKSFLKEYIPKWLIYEELFEQLDRTQ
mgnify:CR=1 FL=1